MLKVKVADIGQLLEGQIVRSDALGRPLLLSRMNGRFHAIEAICSHAGGRLEDGEAVNGCVVCPVHAAIFDLSTGKASASTPWATDLASFTLTADGNDLFVELPEVSPPSFNTSDTSSSDASAGGTCPFSGADHGLDFDPEEPEQRECPFDLYRRARQEMPIFYSERFDLWVVTRYDDIVRILKDPLHFSSAQSLAVGTAVPPEVQAVLDTGFPATPTMVTADPPVHTRFRELVGKAFTSRRVAQMEPHMRALAHRLIDHFYRDGHAEIVRQFAYPLPMEIIAEILGVPPTDMDTFKRWSDDMSARFGPLPLEREVECAKSEVAFQHYFAARLDERRHHPRHDLLTDLLNARVKGITPLDTPESLSILKQLLIGGNETSTNLIGSMLLLLTQNPDQLDALLHDRTLLPNVVEEALRLDSPVQGLFRTATEEIVVGGVRIPQGAHLELLYASGNRDEAHFANPDRFDLHRTESNNHMAFGFGIHFCIGAPLARLEGRIALEAIVDRLPNLRLARGQTVEHHPHFFLRGLKRLELEWDMH
jgi:cytochrome P450/nitrite reductase/ring-hydroxylating ferredoxin subunit